MHSLRRNFLVAISLLPLACGNKGDLYLESSEVLQRELEILDEALESRDLNLNDQPVDDDEVPAKRRSNANGNSNATN